MTRAAPSRPTASSASLALALAVTAPLYVSNYWVGQLLTQMLFLGIAAASLIFLSAYGGMVSLAQVSIYGIAGFVRRQRDDEREHEGPQPRLEPVVGRRRRHRLRRRHGAPLRRRSRTAASASTS